MTWKEFKNEVDEKLQEQGVDGNEKMDYIDVDGFSLDSKDIMVGYDASCGISIS